MRTLTLGVIVVAGGTLAALPFRRYQAIPDASSAPAQVTGPMQSVLESSSPAAVASDLDSYPAPGPVSYGDYVPTDLTQRRSLDRRAASQMMRRRAEIPLTYEDLEVPIDQPEPIKQRFNATAQIRAELLERERVAGLVMPKMESLAVEQIQQIEKVATRFAEEAPDLPKVSGSLASSREAHVDRLPKSTDANRQRHWIRQPD